MIASADLKCIEEIEKQFCKKFDMTDMGELHHFLNIRITRTEEFIRMDQSVYAQKVIDKFAPLMGNLRKIRKTPLPDDAADRLASSNEELTEDQREYVSMFPFRAIILAHCYTYRFTPDQRLHTQWEYCPDTAQNRA
jgi:hypothetical protein